MVVSLYEPLEQALMNLEASSTARLCVASESGPTSK